MSQQRKHVFVDISLWNHTWFDELPLVYQMAYLLLYAETDNVGVWKPHFRGLNFKLKEKIEPENFLEKVNASTDQIEVLDNGDWWLVNYLQVQVKTLTPNNPPHVSYIELLVSHDLLIRYAKDNPQYVNFGKIYEMEDYKSIKNDEKRLKAKKALLHLKKKRLVRPLKEACMSLGLFPEDSSETLARALEDSKDKEKEKASDKGEEKEQEKDEEMEKREETELVKSSTNGVHFNPEIFGEPSL